jgi:membrane protein implicated in regulation of membrane protease activity
MRQKKRLYGKFFGFLSLVTVPCFIGIVLLLGTGHYWLTSIAFASFSLFFVVGMRLCVRREMYVHQVAVRRSSRLTKFPH